MKTPEMNNPLADPWEGVTELNGELSREEFAFLSDLRNGKTIDLADSEKRLAPERIEILCTPERVASALKAAKYYNREDRFRETITNLGIILPETNESVE